MRSLAVLAVLLSLALAACGGDDDASSSPTTAATPAPTETTAGCQDVEAPAAKPDGGARRPKGRLAAARTWTATVKTSCGDFAIRLDVEQAPKTAASFAGLARQGFFDGTIFHRIVPGFVIQGGDPTQTGSGGPGYTVVEPPPADTQYTKGTVAMAKTATEPSGASGSQFYVVTGDTASLPPEYALLGTVSSGEDVVDRIGQLGDASEQPTQPVVVDSITVAGS